MTTSVRVAGSLMPIPQKVSNKNNPHFYELKEIELSAGLNEAVISDPTLNSDRTISVTNLLKDFEKANYPGQNILSASEKAEKLNNDDGNRDINESKKLTP